MAEERYIRGAFINPPGLGSEGSSHKVIYDLVVTLVTTNLLCGGDASGSILSEVSGGVAPYFYLWDDPAGSTTPDLQGVDAGTYTLTVTDSSGAQVVSDPVTLTEPSPIALALTSEDATEGEEDGSASVVAGGGTAPYTYSWEDEDEQVIGTMNSITVGAGTYTVTVTDDNGCSAMGSVTVAEVDVQTSNIIVTSTGVSLNQSVNIISMEDINVDAKNVEKDTFSEPMNGNIQMLNATGFHYPDGAQSHQVHYLEGDNTRFNEVGKQINGLLYKYGITCASLPGPVQYDKNALLKSLCCGVYTQSFYGVVLDRILQDGGKLMLVHNPEQGSAGETLTALDAYFDLTGDDSPIILLSLETANANLYANAQTYPLGGFSWVQILKPDAEAFIAAYPNAKICIDAMQVYKTAPWVVPWNTYLKGFSLSDNRKVFCEQYYLTEDTMKDNPPSAIFDEDQWRESAKYAAMTKFPAMIQQLKDFFGSNFGLHIAAWGTSGGKDAMKDLDTINNMLYTGLFQRQILLETLDDPTYICGASNYRPSSWKIDTNNPKVQFWAQVAFGQLFKRDSSIITTITTPYPNVFGIGVMYEGGKHVMQFVNFSNLDITIPDMTLNGSFVQAQDMTGKVYAGSALNSQTTVVSDYAGVLKKYSIAIIYANE